MTIVEAFQARNRAQAELERTIAETFTPGTKWNISSGRWRYWVEVIHVRGERAWCKAETGRRQYVDAMALLSPEDKALANRGGA